MPPPRNAIEWRNSGARAVTPAYSDRRGEQGIRLQRRIRGYPRATVSARYGAFNVHVTIATQVCHKVDTRPEGAPRLR
jgi:hypothetical protein